MENKKSWEVILTKPAEKVYNKSSKNMQLRLEQCFKNLENNPLYGPHIKPLTGKLKGLYRYRIGDWRVIYRFFKKDMSVEIIAILPRGNAY